MNLHDDLIALADRAVAASRQLALLTARQKNLMLQAMADAVEERRADILAANRTDLDDGRQAGLSPAMLDRLTLNAARLDGMVQAIRAVAELKDPVGARLSRRIRPNGLEILKQRVPIGVIGIIYESRPNVTADSAALCVKASNAVILRGGKESIRSNAAIADALVEGGERRRLPAHAIQLIRTTDHEAVRELVQLEGKVDLVIPRGGESLIRAVAENARVPVIKHYKGVCHTYVDEAADLAKALDICENAKCQRPGVCNAMETLLVHAQVAPEFLPRMAERYAKYGVRLKGCPVTLDILPGVEPATEEDWYAEYLDLILAVRVVGSVAEAVDHINRYGSRHSDAIVTQSKAAARTFTREVDSAAVYVNASTRFTDGGEFGMGAEIGISTDKIHARGPMALEELTTYKYVIHGSGQVRG